MVENVIIIGSGPAGYTASIYAARDNLDPLLIRGFQYGGQLMLTTAVENFPGFPSIQGPDLMEAMYKHVSGLGCRIIDRNVSKVDLSVYPYKVWVEDKEYETKSIIIATGADSKWLGLDSEKKFIGKGVSGCATCDGPFFKNKSVVVVGGGDTAMEDAIYLSSLCKDVTIIHRRDKFRASKVMQDKVFAEKKIKVVWDTAVDEILGEKTVSGVRVKNLKTGESFDIQTQGVFVAIGHSPNTAIFKGQLDIDENGYINVHDFTKTSKRGVFAAGDVQDKTYKQAVIAAGWGSMAAIDVRKFLNEKAAS